MFTEQSILKLSNPVTFERGEKYYNQGRVADFKFDNNILNATVIGTDYYFVKIDLSDLEMECTCPAFNGKNFCKHQVAVMLTQLKGEIKAKTAPKIKRNNLNTPPRGNDLSALLSGFTKDELLHHIEKLCLRDESAYKYFAMLNSKQTDFDYEIFRKQLHKDINYFSANHKIYDYYGKMMNLLNSIKEELKEMPVSKKSSRFLLEEGFWLNNKLEFVDDSHGILASIIDEMLFKAIEHLNGAPVSDLDIFYEYMGKKSPFDYEITILASLLAEVKCVKILDALEEKMIKTINRKDPAFSFSREAGLAVFSEYLFETKPEKFEEVALELIESNYRVRKRYIEYLFDNKRYSEVIEISGEPTPFFNESRFYEDSLTALNMYPELLNFYSSCLSDSFSIPIFKKAINICRQFLPEETDKIVNKAISSKSKSLKEQIELYLLLNMDNELITFLDNLDLKQFEQSRILLDRFTAKYTIINPEIAKIFARILLTRELESISRTNHYNRFMEYIKYAYDLNDTIFLTDLYKKINVNYKNKKKLLELLNLMPNDDSSLQAEFELVAVKKQI